ncbi:MAG: Trigger factor [Candidatus Collierbacteria bacterium GW2011_GWC2_44_18]|uniref:Trigger factor n=1 Tax=Candidatus Collierbacteria bacterium GW2011_GWC2_44_18 TaxID=1618392 RepID=A0A0G1HR82_9BACT|nr:MAG: Trigger factor [Microgenomates group bacterium GW2011_GWC1_44_10]KKT49450.1 MAG: Trigger factor [Candidatus Collierbacteria bacterium GW2011_GWC2_44_18]
MNIKQTKIEKGTAYLEAIVSPEEVDLEKNHVVDEMIKTITVKGFRQGKAPKGVAEKSLDPDKLSDRILNHIMSHLLEHAIEENHYRLLGRPVLEELKAEKDGSWKIKLQLPLYPEIKLGDYVKYLKLKNKKDRKVEDIYQALLDHEKVDVSELVINEEVNYSLERLTSQSKSLNLPLEDYLKALGKTLEQVKREYAESAEKSVKLDLLLLEIAKNQKIDTEDKELLELAKVSNVPSKQIDQLRSIMNRRKTIDYLMAI